MVYLREEGREGHFIFDDSDLSAKVTADPQEGVYIPPDSDATGASGVWVRQHDGRLNIKWFGAVADGVDSLADGETIKGDWQTATSYSVGDLAWEESSGTRLGYICLEAHTSGTFSTDLAAGKWAVGEFTGTDNTTAFVGMLSLHEGTGIPMYVPEGKYRLENPSSTDDSAYLTLTSPVFDLDLDGELLIDEDGTAGKDYNLFKTDTFDSNTNRRERELFRIKGGGKIRGRWSHKPGGNTPDARLHVFAISGYNRVIWSGVEFLDIPGSLSRSNTCDSAIAINCHAERIAKGSLRFQNTNDTSVIGNSIRHTGDDAIDLHAAGTSLRSRQYVAGNQLFDCEGIIALGARNLTVQGNQLELTHGTCIYLGGRVSDEGDNAALNIACYGNTITDPLMASADGSTLAAHNGTQGAIDVGSVQASWIAGDYNGSSVNDPLSSDFYYHIDLDTTDVPQGGSIEVFGNPTRWTRPGVSNFSDYGVGLMFHHDGWIDPAVSRSGRIPNGIVLRSDVENFRIVPNVSGFRDGAGIMLRFLPATVDPRNWSFRNGQIDGGTIRDCQDGLSSSVWEGSAQTYYVDLAVDGTAFDLDPYHVSDGRASDGAWDNGAANVDKNAGIRMRNLHGMSVRGCSFKNLYEPIYGDADKDQAIYRDNVVHCERASPTFSASNKGVGVPYHSNDEFDHVLINATPSDGAGTYNDFTRVVKRQGSVTLADDNATSITPPATRGKVVMTTPDSNNTVAEFFYDVASGAASSVFTGSSASLGTTALTGTDGTDGRINYAAVNDGLIYIENRAGNTRTIRYRFIDG